MPSIETSDPIQNGNPAEDPEKRLGLLIAGQDNRKVDFSATMVLPTSHVGTTEIRSTISSSSSPSADRSRAGACIRVIDAVAAALELGYEPEATLVWEAAARAA